MPVTIYHNPRCNTSRKTLALLREKGVEPQIIEYLKTPYTAAQLKQLLGHGVDQGRRDGQVEQVVGGGVPLLVAQGEALPELGERLGVGEVGRHVGQVAGELLPLVAT